MIFSFPILLLLPSFNAISNLDNYGRWSATFFVFVFHFSSISSLNNSMFSPNCIFIIENVQEKCPFKDVFQCNNRKNSFFADRKNTMYLISRMSLAIKVVQCGRECATVMMIKIEFQLWLSCDFPSLFTSPKKLSAKKTFYLSGIETDINQHLMSHISLECAIICW